MSYVGEMVGLKCLSGIFGLKQDNPRCHHI